MKSDEKGFFWKMKKAGRTFFGVFLLVTITSFWGFAYSFDLSKQEANQGSQKAEIIIHAEERFQTIEGFGSSQRVWEDGHIAKAIGPPPVIPKTIQDQILKELYTDLGLTRVRTHGVGFNTEPNNDNSEPMSFNWSQFRFDCNAVQGCGVDARINFVMQAQKYGLVTIISENNPMLNWMNASNPEEYAENTLALLLHWRERGIIPPYQTLMNEPSQTHWANGIWHREVAKSLGPRMRDEGLKTLLVIPDDLNACSAYPIAKTVMEDPEARKYVGAIAYHMYGGNPGCLKGMKALSLQSHVPVWMTEYYLPPGYADSLRWAKEIHHLIADYGVSAVDLMWGFFGEWVIKRFNEEDLIQITFDKESRYVSHRRTSRYYITGQFSRFVRPGYVRIGTKSTNDAILATAYRGDRKLVVVMINDSPNQKKVDIVMKGTSTPRSWFSIRTTQSENWEKNQSIESNGSRLSITLPFQSVTTLIGSEE